MCWAKNVALSVGGGCDSTLGGEMAKETAKLNTSLKRRGWESGVLFGKDKEDIDRVSKESGERFPVKPFTKKNLIEKLNIISEHTKPGDQFLLNIITHGAPGVTDEGKGHYICLGDNNLLSVNDPELQSALRSINQKGAKVAVLDDSCFGGGSVEAFKDFACVLSTQSSQMVSYALNDISDYDVSFGVTSILRDLIDSSLSDGEEDSLEVNLEDVFLQTLDKYPDRSGNWGLRVFPQISTDPEGNMTSDDLAYFIGESGELKQESSIQLEKDLVKKRAKEGKRFDYPLWKLLEEKEDAVEYEICLKKLEANKKLNTFMSQMKGIAKSMRRKYKRRAGGLVDIDFDINIIFPILQDLEQKIGEIKQLRQSVDEISPKVKAFEEEASEFVRSVEKKYLSEIKMPLSILGINQKDLSSLIEKNKKFNGCKVDEDSFICKGKIEGDPTFFYPSFLVASTSNMGVFEMSASELKSALGTELDIDEKKLKEFQESTKSKLIMDMVNSEECRGFIPRYKIGRELKVKSDTLKSQLATKKSEFSSLFNKLRPYEYAFRKMLKKPSVCRDFKI